MRPPPSVIDVNILLRLERLVADGVRRVLLVPDAVADNRAWLTDTLLWECVRFHELERDLAREEAAALRAVGALDEAPPFDEAALEHEAAIARVDRDLLGHVLSFFDVRPVSEGPRGRKAVEIRDTGWTRLSMVGLRRTARQAAIAAGLPFPLVHRATLSSVVIDAPLDDVDARMAWQDDTVTAPPTSVLELTNLELGLAGAAVFSLLAHLAEGAERHAFDVPLRRSTAQGLVLFGIPDTLARRLINATSPMLIGLSGALSPDRFTIGRTLDLTPFFREAAFKKRPVLWLMRTP